MFGVRGVAVYYIDHAAILGKEDESVFAYRHEAMAITPKTTLALMAG